MTILDRANAFIGHEQEIDEGYVTGMRRRAFIAGFKEGKVGRGRSYRWNLKEYGPPSIPLAQMVIAETEHQIRMDAAWKREMKRLRVRNEKQS